MPGFDGTGPLGHGSDDRWRKRLLRHAHIGPTVLTDMACGHLIIHLWRHIHFLTPVLALAAVDFRGAEVVVESLAAGEGFVDGSGKEWVAWGPSMKLGGSADSKKVNRISLGV